LWTSTFPTLQTATAFCLVHKDGHLILLCSRPNCHEKKYAECDERALVKSCSSSTSWVGGLQKTVDNQLYLQCCEYPLMKDYAQLARDFFYQKNKFLSKQNSIALSKAKYFREYYSLTIHRYFCGRIPDTPPDWYLRRNWPYWPENQTF
uniref:Ricin B-type lectin domain-containing protein n=1 Tax=Angiostrongylus cantonensis TaxID=6313 RepID=A0A0K0DH80_ANGCA